MKNVVVLMLFVLFGLPGQIQGQNRQIRMHGYIDLEYEVDVAKDVSTFDIHHFNLLTSYIYDQFRVFSEIEWEHGPVFDDGDGEGEIVLERAWFEYLYADYLKIRGGKFLTPFGIYNLIHDATPTFLTTSLPFIYNSHNLFGVQSGRLYAKYYTGLQIFGSVRTRLGPRVEYTLGLGNGRGPKQFSADNDHNKAFIARLQMKSDHWEFGLSHYRDSNATGLSGLASAKERVYAADVDLFWKQFRFQSEYAYYSLETPIGFQHPDAYYAQLSYRFYDKITPVVRYDHFDPNRAVAGDSYQQNLIGINISPFDRLYLKSEVQFKSFENPLIDATRLYLSSVSVAF